MKKHLALIGPLLLFATGCGFLSNQIFFVGTGTVRGQVSMGGAPVSGALVLDMDDTQAVLRTTTDPSGNFSIENIPAAPDRTLVLVWGDSFGLQLHYDLAGDVDQDLGKLELKPVGMIQGMVVVSGINPAESEVQVANTTFVARPDATGSFRLALPSGSWSLKLAAPGRLTLRIDDIHTSTSVVTQVPAVSLLPDPDYTCQGSEIRTEVFSQGGGGAVDILFVVDNSGSVIGKTQLARSFQHFVASLAEAAVDYHIAVVTTGMESSECPRCDANYTAGCINETGETGRFQDLLGCILSFNQPQHCVADPDPQSGDFPDFSFFKDPGCRVVTPENLDCFYNSTTFQGTVLAGNAGCGYERGLAAMRQALSSNMLNAYNTGFLRKEARLAVVTVTDEEDCGEVGDIDEDIVGVHATACYYAAKGMDPTGATIDPVGKPYRLTPVSDYAAFLWSLKFVPVLATASAIIGVNDIADPSSTTIEFDGNQATSNPLPTCVTPGCTGNFCSAYPGTRYIQLAQLTGGAIDTICQADFSETLLRVAGASIRYRRSFPLARPTLDPASVGVSVDSQPVATGWSFDTVKQAAVFDEGSAPPVYSLVEVNYQAACP